MANATVFINKHSGRVSALDLKALREEIDGLLKARGVEANFVVEDCTSLIEAVDQCRPDTDYYIVIGGDGTIAALAHAVSAMEGEPPVFVPLPFGTANMFTRDLGLPLDPWRALEAALEAEVKAIDIATVNGRTFLNNVVLGTFAEIAETREQFRIADNLHDKAQSLFDSADALLYSGEHRYRVLIDAEAEDIATNTLVVSNNAFFEAVDGIPRRDRLDAGELAVYLTDAHDGLDFLARVAEAVLGDLTRSEAVNLRTCRRCLITPRDGEPIHYTVDGEILEHEGTLDFRIHPAALRVPWIARESA